MLFRCHITKHRTAVPTDHRRPNGRGDMVVSRGDIRCQRSQGVKGRLVTPLQLLLHVFLNHMHRNMTRSLIHHLHPTIPSPLGQIPLCLQLSKLGLIISIRQRTGPQSVPDRKADIISRHDIADVIPMGPKEVLFVVGEAPLRHDRSTSAYNSCHPLCGHRNKPQKNSRMDGKIIHPLLRLL